MSFSSKNINNEDIITDPVDNLEVITESLIVNGTTVLNGDFSLDGTTINIGATVSETTIGDNLTVVGDVDINGAIISIGATVSETTVEDNITVVGDVDINGAIISIGASVSETTVEDNITIVGDVDINGAIISIGATVSETTIEDNLTVVGDVDINGTVLSLGASVSETTVEDNLNVNNDLTVKNNTFLSSVTGSTTIGSSQQLNISAFGQIIVNNLNQANNTTSGSIKTLGGIATAKNIHVGEDLTVVGDVTTQLNTNLATVSGTTRIGSTDNVIISALGQLRVTNADTSVSTITGSFITTGGAGIAKDINAGGDMFLLGTLTVNNDLICDGDDVDLNADFISLGKAFSTTTVEDDLVVVGDVDINSLIVSLGAVTSEVTVEDNLTVVGNTTASNLITNVIDTLTATTLSIAPSTANKVEIGATDITTEVLGDLDITGVNTTLSNIDDVVIWAKADNINSSGENRNPNLIFSQDGQLTWATIGYDDLSSQGNNLIIRAGNTTGTIGDIVFYCKGDSDGAITSIDQTRTTADNRGTQIMKLSDTLVDIIGNLDVTGTTHTIYGDVSILGTSSLSANGGLSTTSDIFALGTITSNDNILLNMAGANDAEFRIQGIQNAAVIIRADTDNSNETHHPDLMMTQDDGGVWAQFGFSTKSPNASNNAVISVGSSGSGTTLGIYTNGTASGVDDVADIVEGQDNLSLEITDDFVNSTSMTTATNQVHVFYTDASHTITSNDEIVNVASSVNRGPSGYKITEASGIFTVNQAGVYVISYTLSPPAPDIVAWTLQTWVEVNEDNNKHARSSWLSGLPATGFSYFLNGSFSYYLDDGDTFALHVGRQGVLNRIITDTYVTASLIA